jgi:hypothetical protein
MVSVVCCGQDHIRAVYVSTTFREGRSMATQNAAPGSKKRRHTRGYKSYRVKYGPRGDEHQAYARRLSEVGLFIDSNLGVYPPGTTLIMHLEIAGTVYRATGLVRNARRSDTRLIRMLKPGMGIEFIDMSPELKSALAPGP